jgi:hypothetical protein
MQRLGELGHPKRPEDEGEGAEQDRKEKVDWVEVEQEFEGLPIDCQVEDYSQDYE